MPTQTFVRILLNQNGARVSETHPVASRETQPELPPEADAYWFFDRDGLDGEPQNVSVATFIGREATVADVEAAYNADPIGLRGLLANVRRRGITRLVHTRLGRWYPLEINDRVVAG